MGESKMNILGNVQCTQCELTTRFLLFDESSEQVALLGDTLEKEVCGQAECDYCQTLLTIYAIPKAGVLSAFLNEVEYRAYQAGELTVAQAKPESGMLLEKEKNLKQFQTTFTLPFEQQPFQKGEWITIGKEKWKIQSVHKKENIEKDAVTRLSSQVFDEYWYEVTYEEEKKWVLVQDDVKNNAFLTQDMPVLKPNEKIFDITDHPHKTTIILERALGENYDMTAYQMLAGVRVVVMAQTENGKELEYDGFADTFEEALEQIEEVFAVNE